jgi:hypothetical protein
MQLSNSRGTSVVWFGMPPLVNVTASFRRFC